MKKLSTAAAVTGAVVALGLAPAGPATAAAPACSQAWQLKSVTGVIINFVPEAPGTKANTRFEPTCELTRGQSNAGVRGLQFTLNHCYNAGLTIDGKFGPGTESALRAAQRKVGAKVDGRFGPDTRFRLKYVQGSKPATFAKCVGPSDRGQSFTLIKRQA
ncbi:peptidoglycan-binding domain-containing protein [Krasilnikovia sp. MM14-A1004]|uniref:peptidoglycan-binding domain-containing protein n=1 Tax=Krasilnikovia sp. MM14-A1004 TaxID=3373541 RepID=UPI00399C72B5